MDLLHTIKFLIIVPLYKLILSVNSTTAKNVVFTPLWGGNHLGLAQS